MGVVIRVYVFVNTVVLFSYTVEMLVLFSIGMLVFFFFFFCSTYTMVALFVIVFSVCIGSMLMKMMNFVVIHHLCFTCTWALNLSGF